MMIPSVTRLKLVCTSLLLQIILVFGESAEECARIIKENFKLNIEELKDPGRIFVWNISSNNKPFEPMSGEQFSGILYSEETYIIAVKKYRGTLLTYYWLGKDTSKKLKQTVARYAFMFFYHAEMYSEQVAAAPANGLAREYEGVESPSFKETLHSLKNQSIKVAWPYNRIHKANAVYRDTSFHSKFPNLYVIRGQLETRVKKVAVNADWLKIEDACLILETGYSEKLSMMEPLSILCGAKSSSNARNRSYLIAEEFYTHRMFDQCTNFRMVDKTADAKYYDQFCQVLEEGNEHNFFELDNPNDRTASPEMFIENYDISSNLFVLYNQFKLSTFLWPINQNIQRIEVGNRPLHFGLFDKNYDGCYLLNTSSAAGVYLVLGNNSNYQTSVKAIEETEGYLADKAPTKMRIIEGVTYLHRYHDLSINMADWPANPERKDKLWQ